MSMVASCLPPRWLAGIADDVADVELDQSDVYVQSSSEQDAEEQWDDMAIVRAFEEALTDQRTRSSTSAKPTGRKQKTTARSNGKKAARSVSIEEQDDDEEEEQYDGYPAGAPGVPMNGQPHAAAYAGYAAAASSPFAFQQQAQQQQQSSSSDLYQAAYAQAYAQLQAQFQAAYPAAAPQSFGQGPAMPAFPGQSSYYPQPPPMPSMPTPFPGMPGATAPFPGSTPSAATSDDGLANVLMAWYQSGYYTGRFQAMQEMKMRGRR